MENHTIITAVVILIFSIMTMFILAYCVYRLGRVKSVENDLIYLEFLIRNSLGSAIDRKNILSILNEYTGSRAYQCDKLAYIERLFHDKFDDIDEYCPEMLNYEGISQRLKTVKEAEKLS